jgi:hypothetical protein
VVSVHPEDNEPSRRRSRAEDAAAIEIINDELGEGRSAKTQGSTEADPLADPDEDPLGSDENPMGSDEPGP